MLMGLIGRGKDAAIDAQDAAVPDMLASVKPPASDNSPEPQAEPQTAPAKPKRASKGMRSSDIRDENGRSAEEIAAEAAKEFDIMGLALRVSQMPDVAPKSAPDQPAPTPAPEMAGDPVPELSGAEAIAAQRMQEVALGDDEDAFEALPDFDEQPAETGAFFADGHFTLERGDAQTRRETRAARQAYWSKLGLNERELLSATKSVPGVEWPSGLPKFRVIRTSNSLIIATEGLSDPFPTMDSRAGQNGFGLEVFVEIEGWQGLPFENIRKTWGFQALEVLSEICARAGGLEAPLREHKLLSVALPLERGPKNWLGDDPDASLGGLINMPMPPARNMIANTPLSEVRAVPITLITASELDECIVEGAAGRRALADDLLTTGTGHRTAPARANLR